MTAPSAPRTPGTSVRKTTRLACVAPAPESPASVSALMLKICPPGPRTMQATTGIRPRSRSARSGRGVNLLGLPDQPNIRGGLTAGTHKSAVHAADADGGDAGGIEQGHKLLVDGAGKHHDGQLQGLVVGDAQPIDKRGLLVHTRQPVGERRRRRRGRSRPRHRRYVARARSRQHRLAVGQRAPANLHHDRLSLHVNPSCPAMIPDRP